MNSGKQFTVFMYVFALDLGVFVVNRVLQERILYAKFCSYFLYVFFLRESHILDNAFPRNEYVMVFECGFHEIDGST